MGNIEQPPFAGEIPNTLFGVMPIGGVINDPGAFGEMGGGPVRAFGEVNNPPCKGIMDIP